VTADRPGEGCDIVLRCVVEEIRSSIVVGRERIGESARFRSIRSITAARVSRSGAC
jgi:hypothetical protein